MRPPSHPTSVVSVETHGEPGLPPPRDSNKTHHPLPTEVLPESQTFTTTQNRGHNPTHPHSGQRPRGEQKRGTQNLPNQVSILEASGEPELPSHSAVRRRPPQCVNRGQVGKLSSLLLPPCRSKEATPASSDRMVRGSQLKQRA